MKFRLLLGILLVGANIAAAETHHTQVCVSQGSVAVASASLPDSPIPLPPGSCAACPGNEPCAPPPAGGAGLSSATLKALAIGGGAAAAVGIGVGAAAGVGAFDSSHSNESVRSRAQ